MRTAPAKKPTADKGHGVLIILHDRDYAALQRLVNEHSTTKVDVIRRLIRKGVL